MIVTLTNQMIEELNQVQHYNNFYILQVMSYNIYFEITPNHIL